MTISESVTLAEKITDHITGDGIPQSSGLFHVCSETVNGKEYIGYVDVYINSDEITGEREFGVYSIVCENNGNAICEPEWDYVSVSVSALAKYIRHLVNVVFKKSEIERLIKISEI